MNKVCLWILNYHPENKFKTELFHRKRNWDIINCKNIILKSVCVCGGGEEKVPKIEWYVTVKKALKLPRTFYVVFKVANFQYEFLKLLRKLSCDNISLFHSKCLKKKTFLKDIKLLERNILNLACSNKKLIYSWKQLSCYLLYHHFLD